MYSKVVVMQKGNAVWPWVVVGVVALGGAGAWLFQENLPKMQPSPAPATSTPAGPAAVDAASPSGTVPAAPRYPLEGSDAADPALPALSDSDASALQALHDLLPADALALLLREHLIQRVVVHVDNLTQPSLPASAMALRPVAGVLAVESTQDGSLQLAAANALRYRVYVEAFSQADMPALAAAYRRFYPLIQQAWREIGHPDGHFNDRLVAVIDHLLQTPEPAQPLLLERDERGRYRFVDPDLQARSVGQKALLRLDREQARAVRQQLHTLRAALTRG